MNACGSRSSCGCLSSLANFLLLEVFFLRKNSLSSVFICGECVSSDFLGEWCFVFACVGGRCVTCPRRGRCGGVVALARCWRCVCGERGSGAGVFRCSVRGFVVLFSRRFRLAVIRANGIFGSRRKFLFS